MSTATVSKFNKNVKIASQGLWYTPDPRLCTRSASNRAAAIVKWIESGDGLDGAPDERALFVALHTCAYRATRPRPGKYTPRVQRRKWTRGWQIIREYIVEQNLGLVFTTVARFRSKDLDHDDRVSEGMFGLARAVDRFNPWRGIRFSTYACHVIIRALMRRCKMETRYRRLFPINSKRPFERGEHTDVGTEYCIERLERAMRHNLGNLTELESKVLAQRFPADYGSPLTFRQIGEAVGLSKERVRQIQNVALAKLRDVLDADPLL
jgi:RNA polymerase sigma factor (sigma-70 family)